MRKFTPLPVAAAILAALPGMAAAAEDADRLEPVVVTASRVEQPLSQAAATINVVTAKDIEETAPLTFSETLLDLPNVDVTAPSDPYFNRISIRGSDANQITYLVDGMRQDDATNGGNMPIGIFADPEIVKQVEVKHGGGSALYGNGGIGGVISVTTKDAADFLAGTDRNFGALIKTGYSDDSRSWQKGAYVFGRYGIWDAVLGVNRRDYGDSRTSRTGRRSSGMTDGDYTSVLAKVSAAPNDSTLFSLTYNYDKGSDDYDYSASEEYNNYSNEQHRVTGRFEYENGPLVNMKAAIQYVHSEYKYDALVDGYWGANTVGNHNKFDSLGGNIQNTSILEGFGAHNLTYGGDIYKKKQKGVTFDESLSPDWTTTDARPKSEGLDAGLFIQDEWWVNKYLSVTPVLRWNYYKRESKAGLGFDSVDDNKFTPGVTIALKPSDSFKVWGSVAQGYRPPILDELYTTMTYGGMYRQVVVANPDLKPEKSTNYEIGASANVKNVFTEGDGFNGKAALFYDDVKDFISAGVTDFDVDDDGFPTTMYYTTQNYGHVVRKGIELSGAYYLGNFGIAANYGLTRATDREDHSRVAGVTPQSANVKLSYAFPAFDMNLWYKFHWSKGGKSAVLDRNDEYQHLDSYTTHALGVEWAPKIQDVTNLKVGLSVNNLLNKKYRMLNGSYGYGRGVRAWVSAQF